MTLTANFLFVKGK